MSSTPSGDPSRSGIYMVIRLVALADMGVGLALWLLGPSILGTEAYRYVGLGLAIAGLVVFAFFTRLAAQARRR
jgi:hypothetical protein